MNAAKSLSARPPRSLQVFSPPGVAGASSSDASRLGASLTSSRARSSSITTTDARDSPGCGACRAVSPVVLAPEGVEGDVEDRNLFLAMDEQRAARVIDLVACAEVHVPERLDDIEQAAAMDVDARAPQEAAEDQQVSRRRDIGAAFHARDALRAMARSSSSIARRPAERSEIFLRLEHDAERFVDRLGIERVPVERDERGHPVDGLGHAGLLVQVRGAQLLHHRGHLLGKLRRRVRDACSRTMASSFSNDGYSIH